MRGVIERAVQADDVGAGEDVVKRRVLRRTRRGATAFRPQHVHAEGARDFRDALADVAGADDAERFAGEVDNRQFVQAEAAIALPVAVDDRLMIWNQTTHGGEDGGEGVFGNGSRGITGDVGKAHAVVFAGVCIDVIDASGGDLYQLEVR